jgi:hypothetical protein
MSDSKIPIQTDSPDELAGGQKLARTDDPVYARNGNTVSQVFPLTGATGVEVQGAPAKLVSPAANSREAANVNTMACDAPVAVSVKQTSHRAIEGSNAANDFRKGGDVAAASLAAASGSTKGPRDPVQQFPNGKNCK